MIVRFCHFVELHLSDLPHAKVRGHPLQLQCSLLGSNYDVSWNLAHIQEFKLVFQGGDHEEIPIGFTGIHLLCSETLNLKRCIQFCQVVSLPRPVSTYDRPKEDHLQLESSHLGACVLPGWAVCTGVRFISLKGKPKESS
ncbi:uncharacterized protein [Macaca nemestrina]|uniref:uncharacterized protein isoform X1 n=1 Tax=Macaca nemestrina TaxID=9545 RepID=UPI0039B9C3F3